MSSSLNFAIVGAGLIGPRHAQSVTLNRSTTLVALVEPSPNGRAIGDKLQTQHFTSVADMLASTKPEAAIVCTPNHTHVEVTTELLSAGVHVLVEKPVSESIESGISLLRYARATPPPQPKLLVGHHRRFNPYVLKTKQVIDSGSLGKVIAVNGLWTMFKPDEYFASPAEWRRSRSSGGVIPINLVHDIDILQYFFGSITRVHAEGTKKQRANPPHDAEEGCAVTLRFASGVVGTFLCCDATPSPHNFEIGTGENPNIPKSSTNTGADFYRIFGTEASLSVPDMRRWSYDGREEKSWTQPLCLNEFEVNHATPFDMQLSHFVEVIRGDAAPGCTCEDGLRALMVCDAVERSLESGQPVDVDSVLDIDK